MSGDRIRLSPVVASLTIAQAAVGILLATVFTLPSVPEALRFDPGSALARPWTVLTYFFAHPGPIPLGINLILLAGFGPHLERRMGGAWFLLYYVGCGIGTALFGLGLTSLGSVPPLLGANGAVLGVALAFWFAWPDARLLLDPIPARPRVSALIVVLAMMEVAIALFLEQTQHLAYLGGLVTGYLIFRLHRLRAHRIPSPPPPAPVRAVMKPVSVPQGGRPAPLRQPQPPQKPPAPHQAEELDRVLDKISASGMQSLTAAEREFLDLISDRKRRRMD
ncbi:MAG TPA: rhomboid family intramembrane serine protease [Gemmatimonadales bacterium]|nr:rhomboid family intramembrane serine protease [Gemmatimonadales bacterium]